MKLLRTEVILFVALLVTMMLVPVAGATGDELHAAPTNPEFIRYMNENLSGSQVQDGTHRLGVIPSPIYHPEIRDIQMFGPNAGDRSTSYQSLFDLRASGKVSPVKNQNPNGTCWAFATYSSLESTLMPATPTPNFSEKNLVNLAGFIMPGSPEDAGGTAKMSTAYLARWNGPVNSSTDPYPTVAGTWTNSSTYPPVKHVQNVVFFPGRTNRTDTDNIKGGLIRWGALYTVFNVFDDNESDILWYNASYTSFYQPASDPYHNNSHAVAFVGWNDAYEATNFTLTPPGPGAWIVKNSWGTGWGDGGFFYVSYYDKFIGSAIDNQSSWDTVAFLGENTSNYDTVYSYDKLGEVQDYTYGTNKTGSFANVFTANSSETIKAVGFYTTDLNVPTTISIYKNPTSGPVGGTLAAQFSQTLLYMGYNTVVIPSGQEVSVTAGDKFSVVVQVINPINDEYIPIEQNMINYTSGITSQLGQGYLLNSSGWYDIKTELDNTHICVKAYTSSASSPPVANFSGTPLSGTVPLTVIFTDSSTNTPTNWSWDFGDGNFSAVQNPVYTYVSASTYTVSLRATNAAGSDTKTASNYITVTAPSGADNVGVYRGGVFYLNGADAIVYGLPTDTPVIGDWNRDRISKVGVYRGGVFYRNGATDIVYGLSTDTPVIGDWNGDGTSKVGVFRDGVFYRDGYDAIVYGLSTDTPVIGDWNGDGISKVGVFRGGVFYRNGYDAIVYGLPTDTPVIGDWNGDRKSEVGVYRDGVFYRNGATDIVYGLSTDTPVIGKWT